MIKIYTSIKQWYEKFSPVILTILILLALGYIIAHYTQIKSLKQKLQTQEQIQKQLDEIKVKQQELLKSD